MTTAVNMFLHQCVMEQGIPFKPSRFVLNEAADDAFCNSLLHEYESDPDKGNPINIEDIYKK